MATKEEDDKKRKILRNGESVRTPLMMADRMALDSCCCVNAALDRQQRSRDMGYARGAEIVKAMQDDAADDPTGQEAYRRRISAAWKHRGAH